MRCPYCDFSDIQVKDTRVVEGVNAIRRRRYCSNCKQRFTTLERIQVRELVVKKRDGTVEPFSPEKLTSSLRVSLHKIDEYSQIEQISNELQRELESYPESEIASEVIGELVMETLKNINKVAYVRYACVYKSFREIQEVNDLLSEMKN